MTRLKITRVPVDVVTLFVAMLFVAAFTLVDASGEARRVWLSLVVEEASLLVTVLLVMRVGLLATVFSYAATILVSRIPLTLDGSRFYAGQGWVMLAAMLIVCGIGLRWATAGKGQEVRPA